LGALSALSGSSSMAVESRRRVIVVVLVIVVVVDAVIGGHRHTREARSRTALIKAVVRRKANISLQR
jgi:hypothetical protein